MPSLDYRALRSVELPNKKAAAIILDNDSVVMDRCSMEAVASQSPIDREADAVPSRRINKLHSASASGYITPVQGNRLTSSAANKAPIASWNCPSEARAASRTDTGVARKPKGKQN